jgi:hypothetical protein
MSDNATSDDTSTGDKSGVKSDTNDTSTPSVVVENNENNDNTDKDIGNDNDINDDCAYMMIDRRLLNDIALSNGLMEGTNKVSPAS